VLLSHGSRSAWTEEAAGWITCSSTAVAKRQIREVYLKAYESIPKQEESWRPTSTSTTQGVATKPQRPDSRPRLLVYTTQGTTSSLMSRESPKKSLWLSNRTRHSLEVDAAIQTLNQMRVGLGPGRTIIHRSPPFWSLWKGAYPLRDAIDRAHQQCLAEFSGILAPLGWAGFRCGRHNNFPTQAPQTY